MGIIRAMNVSIRISGPLDAGTRSRRTGSPGNAATARASSTGFPVVIGTGHQGDDDGRLDAGSRSVRTGSPGNATAARAS